MSSILIAEDTRMMRDFLAETLTAAGHRVTTAENGSQAIARVAGGEVFDLVITDLIMPEVDGIQTIVEIRTMRPDAKIIAISAGSPRLDVSSGLDAAARLGAAAVLEKPIAVDVLLAAVTRALGG
ncbi:MAG: response regulator [Magnetospirillum sp.]|nr:response regulator [Magnetospirillum sp.]